MGAVAVVALGGNPVGFDAVTTELLSRTRGTRPVTSTRGRSQDSKILQDRASFGDTLATVRGPLVRVRNEEGLRS